MTIVNGTTQQVTDASSGLISDTLSATTAAQPLPNQSCMEVIVQNDPSNTVNLLVGGSAKQTMVITPGQSFALDVTNANLVYVAAKSGTAIVNWLTRS